MLKQTLFVALISASAFAHEGMSMNDDNHKKMHEISQKNFKDSDTNNDGSLTQDEFKTFHSKMETSREQNKPSVEEKFQKIDSNKDGLVSNEELKQHHKMPKGHKNHNM